MAALFFINFGPDSKKDPGKMKKNFRIASAVVIVTVLALIVFNNLTSRSRNAKLFAVASHGRFEVTISGTGELIAERSSDILAPEVLSGGRGGGGDIRISPMKITDLVPEGTIVKKGDFIAQLDKTDYNNNLKDDIDKRTSLLTSLEVKNLDSAVTLTGLRDGIKNQSYIVSEAEMTLKNSKYESPEIIRQAEIAFDKAKRVLEQNGRTYRLRKAQAEQDIRNIEFYIERVSNRIKSTEELLQQFTIYAPSDGMLIYKRDFRGSKRKVGTMITPFDRVVATIPDLSSMISKTFISEIDVTKLGKGLTADISVDAFPLRSYKGKVLTIANIGETLNNSDTKVFETQVRLDGVDPDLRPGMTTGNRILVKAAEDAIYIPTECLQSTPDSLTFVYTKNHLKQFVVTGISNDKFTVIEKGLKSGTQIYLSQPENPERFRVSGLELKSSIRDEAKNRTSGVY
jgi:HlyD family secretion protein